RIVILKSESESSDSYATLLRENNFDPIFVPTLGFGFKNLDVLKAKLNEPGNYAGLVFTSPRSVEACEQAIKGTNFDKQWKQLHNYCVGDVTHNMIHVALDLNTREGHRLQFPFLFPCGNLRQDTLQLKLLDYGYFMDPIEVYETTAHPDLELNLRKALIEDKAEYLAFFSPSGVNFVNAILKKLEIKLSDYKLIAIGPSTRKSLETNDLTVFKTAEKPSVEYLVKALLAAA
ncbi:Uroporphyrinogen-III synthase, partial [Pseudolycoriella hygida]